MDVNSLKTYSSLFAGAIGAVCGALLTRALSRRREKIALVFEMHKELNAAEMSKHRRRAAGLIEKYPNNKLSELSRYKEDEVISVLMIMRFYQRLWISIKYNQVKDKFVPELFSEVFYYWYFLSFANNIDASWDAAAHIDMLAAWFEKKDKRRYAFEKRTMGEKRAKWLKQATINLLGAPE